MTCGHVKRLLSAYIDGELSGLEMLRIRDHLGQCAACNGEVEALRAVKSLLLQQPAVEPSADFESRLVGAVFASTPPLPKKVAWFTISLTASAAAAIATFVLLQVGHSRDNAMAKAEMQRRPDSFSVQQDQAMMAGSDPLSGQAPIVMAGYGKR